jgi:dihydropyrimidinase
MRGSAEVGDLDLVIHGATIVTAEQRRVADVGIRGETIAEIGSALRGRREIDASGLYLFPGGVDPHVHLSCVDLPMGGDASWTDDFQVGSRAAFAGGITTVGNMTFVDPTETLARGVARETELVAAQAIADVFVHLVLSHPGPSALDQLAELFGTGQPSLKMFMSAPTFDANLATYFRAMEAVGKAGGIALIHCEDAGCIGCSTNLLTRMGASTIRHYAASRPPASELRAVQRAIALCELTGCPTYIVHLSTEAALGACSEARARGLPLFVETRPMYLHLTQAAYETELAGLFVGQPPLRSATDCEALWAGLFDGRIDTLGSDHAPWRRATKLAPSHDINTPRPGVADLETMLPMLFSEGVLKRGLALERFVALTSENPARLFGLYPRKGTIQVGSDADLVVWDPKRVRKVEGAKMHSQAGYSVYDGTVVTGWPRWTIRRGEVVLSDDGGCHGRVGSGRLVGRRTHEQRVRLPGSSAK